MLFWSTEAEENCSSVQAPWESRGAADLELVCSWEVWLDSTKHGLVKLHGSLKCLGCFSLSSEHHHIAAM